MSSGIMSIKLQCDCHKNIGIYSNLFYAISVYILLNALKLLKKFLTNCCIFYFVQLCSTLMQKFCKTLEYFGALQPTCLAPSNRMRLSVVAAAFGGNDVRAKTSERRISGVSNVDTDILLKHQFLVVMRIFVQNIHIKTNYDILVAQEMPKLLREEWEQSLLWIQIFYSNICSWLSCVDSYHMNNKNTLLCYLHDKQFFFDRIISSSVSAVFLCYVFSQSVAKTSEAPINCCRGTIYYLLRKISFRISQITCFLSNFLYFIVNITCCKSHNAGWKTLQHHQLNALSSLTNVHGTRHLH